MSVWTASLRHIGQGTGRRWGLGIEQGAPAGVADRPGLPPTPFLADWLWFHAERRPGAPCVAAGEVRLTYGDLASRVHALAADLSRRGVGPRTRVLMALSNTPAAIIGGLAINLLGATSVEVSRSWSAEVLGDVVARAGTRHLIVAARDAATWQRALVDRAVEHTWVVYREPPRAGTAGGQGTVPATAMLEDGTIDAPAGSLPAARPEPDWPALILYTSGSTGRPQGVIQTFANVDANTRSIVEYLGLTPDDRALLTLPLAYCYGRSVLQTHLLAGGSLVLDDRMAFPRRVMETAAAEGCTGFAGVPLTFEILRRSVDLASIPMTRLRYVTQAGGAMAPDTIAWARSSFAPAVVFVMYGQTEATARLSYLPPERAEDKAGSIGIPIPGVELKVVDASGAELPVGEVGEIVARGANVTPGYLDDPEETSAILHDGWLWTGDLGEMDAEGYLFHRGRARDILKIGGHRVSPAQIEQVIAGHPAVEEVAVVGVADALLGEVPAAVVVLRRDASVDAAELVALCRANLPAPLVPAVVTFARSLPRNEAGKLQRAVLAAALAKG